MYAPVYHEEEQRILVVDDNLVNLKLLTGMLSQHGYKVDAAKDAKTALEQIQDQYPDLILLDIKMPEMNGYQLCTLLKSRVETQHIPIIFFSGITQSIEKIKAFSVGGVDFITKPFQGIEVIIRIEHQLKLANLQKELIAKNKILEAEVQHRSQIESLLMRQKDQLEREIKQRKFMESLLRDRNVRLSKQANVDALTQVANRRHFDGCLAREWQRATNEGQPLSIVLCDVDYFKLYNDSYGHQEGDSCLYQVAQTLASVANLPGDLVARYGGEEFVLILPDTYNYAAIAVIQNIQKLIEELHIKHEKSEVADYVTVSFGGVTLLPNEKANTDELLKRADESLYRAKRQGRNQVCWCDEQIIVGSEQNNSHNYQ
ncbi:MAG: diguanylate cyclase [Limnothrix sp.]